MTPAFAQALAVLRDDRKQPLDRLKSGAALIKYMMEGKSAYRREIPDAMIALLERLMKGSRFSFEGALPFFMISLGATC